MTARTRQAGAALLLAMLTVTLVATLSAAALWQQWRGVEVEAAERSRVQATWVLVGALDWARLILREDGRAGGPDHLAEPWAVPLEEARLSSFLAAEKNVTTDSLEGLPDALMSGRIVDAQSKLNVLNLVDASAKPVPASVAAFSRLFNLLGLPAQELGALTVSLARALAGGDAVSGSGDATAASPLLPQHTSQLVWLGLSPTTAAALEPYVTVLPVRTPVNLNTAAAEVIYASTPSLDMAGAQRLVERRKSAHFQNLSAANDLVRGNVATLPFTEDQHSVSTRFFEVWGRLRLDRTWVEEHSLVQRDGINVQVLWRERGAGTASTTLKP
ncbi:MAG: ral secretion pathway protein [Variovorax sp.]|nr:ral secretion pathway protein [Variovorax sp.]